MMNKYIEIDLTEGLDDQSNGAFDAAKVAEAAVTPLEIAQFLAAKLNPIAQAVGPLLNEGAGFALVWRGGDDFSIIGLAAEAKEPAQ